MTQCGSSKRPLRWIALALASISPAVRHSCVTATCLNVREGPEGGISDIGSTTNGFWAVNSRIALQKCEQLRDVGVTYLEVSLDHWHLPHIDLARVKCLIDAARATGIRLVLRTLTTRNHGVDEIVALLLGAGTDLSGVLIANSKVQPVGRAATDVSDDEIYYGSGDTAGSCDTALNLTIAPTGNVYPCCAGSEMTDALAFGNVTHEPLPDIVTKMRTDLLLRTLVHTGSGSLIPILQELGLAELLLPRYSSICHLCWHIFQDDTMAAALKEHFADLQFEELLAMVTRLTPEGEAVGDDAGREAARSDTNKDLARTPHVCASSGVPEMGRRA